MPSMPSNFEAAFRTIAETASDAIITIDEHNTILLVNPAAQRIFGYAIDEMLGQPMTMLMPECLRRDHKDGLARYVQSGQPHMSWAGMELSGLHKDGRTIPLEISFGEFFSDGARLFTGIVRDITRRKHEERLRSAYMAAVRILAEHPSSGSVLSETLRAICHALEWKVGILWHTDPASDALNFAASWCEDDEWAPFVWGNQTFGFSRGHGLPGRVWAAKQAEWAPEFNKADYVRRKLADQCGLISAVAFPVVVHNEVIAVMEFFNTEIQWPDNELLDSFMSIGHQMGQYMERTHAEEALARSEAELRRLIASEKEAREQAEAANRMKDEFLALLSHELRTPLTSVFGWVQLLTSPKADPSMLAKGLKVIDRNIRLQVQLVNDLLNVSQIISGKLQIRRESVDPLHVVKSAIDTVRPSAEAKQLSLCLISDADLPAIFADPGRLHQIVWNLLSNAVKFTPWMGTIMVKVNRAETHLRIMVHDTGEGIPDEFLPRIFNRFSQADVSTTRRHGGLGLGLSLVRQLVELHGGTVAAESPGKNQGSTFTVNLPLPGTSAPFREPMFRGANAGSQRHV